MERDNMVALGIAILISLIFIFSGSLIRVIPAGHIGVVFNLFGGVEKRVLQEGINILIPIVETAAVYDARKISYNFTEKYESGSVGQNIQCQTNDGQKIAIDVSVIVHLKKDDAWKLHQQLGRNYVERLIVPQIRGIFRNIVAKYPIETVYTAGRTGLALDAAKAVRNSFLKSGVILDDILIRRIKFAPSFADAVERKQIALQESQRQQWVKKTAEQEKERRIIEGEGEARALQVRGEAIMLDPRIAELEFLDKLEKSGKDITVVTGANNAIISIGNIFNPQITPTVETIKKE